MVLIMDKHYLKKVFIEQVKQSTSAMQWWQFHFFLYVKLRKQRTIRLICCNIKYGTILDTPSSSWRLCILSSESACVSLDGYIHTFAAGIMCFLPTSVSAENKAKIENSICRRSVLSWGPNKNFDVLAFVVWYVVVSLVLINSLWRDVNYLLMW